MPAAMNDFRVKSDTRPAEWWLWLVIPVIIAAPVVLYTGLAWWIGQNRNVYFVNGFTRPYTIAVGGQQVNLQPGQLTLLQLAEGDIAVNGVDVDLGEVQSCAIHTPFWSRPFARQTFVINPDRLANIIVEEIKYGSGSPQVHPRPKESHVGKLVHSFANIDYRFAVFPAKFRVTNQYVIKRRIAEEPFGNSYARSITVAKYLSSEEQAEYARQYLRMDPDDATTLYWLTRLSSAESLIYDIKPHLAARPIHVAWHQTYLRTQESADPNDLRAEYEQLVSETGRSPEAVYLLALLEEEPAATKLFEEVMAGNPTSPYLMANLAHRELGRGEPQDALRWARAAHDLRPDDPIARRVYHESLLATGKFQQLHDATPDYLELSGDILRDHLSAMAKLQDIAGADASFQAYMAQWDWSTVPDRRRRWEIWAAAAMRNRETFLKLLQDEPSPGSYELAILDGRPHDAATFQPSRDDSVAFHALVCLAAEKAGQNNLAEAHYDALLDALWDGDRNDRQMVELIYRDVLDFEAFRNLYVGAESKRFIAAVLARRRTSQADELLAFARKLNTRRDRAGMCLVELIGD
jgi:hypothetical protein